MPNAIGEITMSEDVGDYLYPLDTTGRATTNKVVGEKHTLNPPLEPVDFHFIIPHVAPFYKDSMVIRHLASNRILIQGIDWSPAFRFYEASEELHNVEGGLYGAILFYDRTLSGQVELEEYQTLGGSWTLSDNKILEILSNRAVDPRVVSFEDIADKPDVFQPIGHEVSTDDLIGMSEQVNATLEIAAAIRERTEEFLNNPPAIMENYHLKDVVDSLLFDLRTTLTSDILTVTELLNSHISDYNNPHRDDKYSVNLGNLENYPVANEQEARAGEANDRYMTPLRTRQSNESHSGPSVYDSRYVKKGEGDDVTVSGPTSVVQDTNVFWTLTNYDEFSEYTVNVNQGNVSISGETISYAMPSGQLASQTLVLTITRNGIPRPIEIELITAGINQPSIISPLQGEALKTTAPTISLAAFSTSPANSDTHVSTDWIISSDPDFLSIIFQSLNDTVNKTSIVPTGLSVGVVYYLRVRFHGSTYADSPWAILSFNTATQWSTSFNTSHSTQWDTAYTLTTSHTTDRLTEVFTNGETITTTIAIVTSYDTNVGQVTSRTTDVIETFNTGWATSRDTVGSIVTNFNTSWDTDYVATTTFDTVVESYNTSRTTQVSVEQSQTTSHITAGSQVTGWTTNWNTEDVSTTSYDTIVSQRTTSTQTAYVSTVLYSDGYTYVNTSVQTGDGYTQRITAKYVGGAGYYTQYAERDTSWVTNETRATSRSTASAISTQAYTSILTAVNRITNYTTSWSSDSMVTTSYVTEVMNNTARTTTKSRSTSGTTGRTTSGTVSTVFDTFRNTSSSFSRTTSYVTNSDRSTSRTTTYETDNITNV